MGMTRITVSALAAIWAVCAWTQDWPSLCHDQARSGICPAEGPSAAEEAWAVTLGGSVDGSPVVADGRVYVGNNRGSMFCLKADDGEAVWEFAAAGPIVGAAEVREGTVYFGSVDGFVYALSADTGQLSWRHRTNRPVLCSPVCSEGKVVFGSMDGTIRAVEAATGRQVWRCSAPAGISASPALAEGVLYFGDEDGNLLALRLEDGSEVWRGKLPGRIIAAPTVAGGRLLVPLMSRSSLSPPATEIITAWNPTDGTKLWTIPKPGAQSVMGSPVVYGSTVWVFSVEGYVSSGVLRGFSLDDGKPVAERKMEGADRLVVDASLAIAGDALYIAGQNGMLYVRDASSGVARKRLAVGGRMFSSPAIANGLLYVGAQDGKLHCIR